MARDLRTGLKDKRCSGTISFSHIVRLAGVVPRQTSGFIGLNPVQCAAGINEQPEAKLNVTIEIRTSVIQEEAGNLGI